MVRGERRVEEPFEHDPQRRDLEDISARTLDHYNRRAEDFWKARSHDVSQNIAAARASR